jgi:uncharacterized SAM-binding protein YcdF (DUF218 family)
MDGGAGIRRSSGRLILRSFAVVGVLMAVISLTPVVRWWGIILAGPWNDPSGDVLIVLGGSTLDPEVLGESSYWRSVYAIRAYKAGGFRQIVVVGGGDIGATIADTMATFLRCQGVPGSALSLERHSRSTRENALFTRDTLATIPGRKVLMTSDYHMMRAARAFRKVGVDFLPRPVPDAIKRAGSFQHRFGAFVDETRETVALAYYFVRGWI